MRRLSQVALAGLLSGLLVWPAGAQTPRAKPAGQIAGPAVPAPGNAQLGQLKSEDERCQECHGHDGNANDIQDGVGNIGKFPRLAGQNADYLRKQFREFRSGKRNNEIMSVMAKTVSDADLADIAAYFSSQQPLSGDGKGDNPLGRKLFAEGDSARGLLPCVGCHAGREPAAVANPSLTPQIAGQHRRYLQKQLIEWRAGERHNSPGDIMNSTARLLSDAEIDALADYLSSL